jgi:glycosyltransferase involved in cell wall biosynthesis
LIRVAHCGDLGKLVVTDPSRPSPRALLISLETLREGRAASTHALSIWKGLEAEGAEAGLIARICPHDAPIARLGRLWDYLSLSVKAASRFRSCDLLYIRSHPAAVGIVIAALLARKPVIHEVNGQMADLGVTYRMPHALVRFLVWLQNWQYRQASGLVAVTQGLADHVQAAVSPLVPVGLISNGVDIETFRPDAPGGPYIDAPYVLLFGGLVSWHGIEDAAAALDDEHWPKGVVLVIAGDGPSLETARQLAEGRTDMIVTGHLPQTELAGLIARSLAVLVLISPTGGRGATGSAPLKLFEGMASGRPIIATDLPFTAELVRGERCGMLVTPGNVSELARAASDLHSNTAEGNAMGLRGREAAVLHHSWTRRARETALFFRRIVHGSE